MYIKRILFAMPFGAVWCFFSGCATAPSSEVMRAETEMYRLPELPAEGKAMVYVVRPTTFFGGLIRFNVFLDNQNETSEIGYTRGGQYIYFSVSPGDHKIYSEAENCADYSITVKSGEIIFLQQEPTVGILMARNNLFKLEDYRGKYQVKNLKVGTIYKIDQEDD